MGAPTYDIFAGHIDKDAVWVEAVEGLGRAAMRMGQLAAEKPGAYFVFSLATHSVVVSVDTTSKSKAGEGNTNS